MTNNCVFTVSSTGRTEISIVSDGMLLDEATVRISTTLKHLTKIIV
jgi:hypothetical protein